MVIIWSQVLEGHMGGETSYFVSIDLEVQVGDVLPLAVAIERANDSAVRQIRRWKFKPLVKAGVTLQMEGVLQFAFNTRAYAPTDMLKDEEGRKYATNIVEPDYPTGAAAASTCAGRV